MKYLKNFESVREGISASESNRIKGLPGFDFVRSMSGIYGYFVYGKRKSLPLEDIKIYKKGDMFELDIKRYPGYYDGIKPAGVQGWEVDWKEKEWSVRKSFDDIASLIDFLSGYQWHDLK